MTIDYIKRCGEQEKRAIGRPRCKLEESITMDLQEVGRGSMD
jgi:hypothetical protein